jgi:hypothetical protein
MKENSKRPCASQAESYPKPRAGPCLSASHPRHQAPYTLPSQPPHKAEPASLQSGIRNHLSLVQLVLRLARLTIVAQPQNSVDSTPKFNTPSTIFDQLEI